MKRVRVVSAEISSEQGFLLAQRLPTATLPLLWEFPGGRVRDGETEQEALVRCLADRLAVEAKPVERVMQVEHGYDDYEVVLSVWRVELVDTPTANRVNAVAWVPLEELGNYEFPSADRKTVELLLEGE